MNRREFLAATAAGAALTLAPRPGRALLPWARSAQTGAPEGGNRFDLTRWDPAYFERLRHFVEEAGRRNIVGVGLIRLRPSTDRIAMQVTTGRIDQVEYVLALATKFLANANGKHRPQMGHRFAGTSNFEEVVDLKKTEDALAVVVVVDEKNQISEADERVGAVPGPGQRVGPAMHITDYMDPHAGNPMSCPC